MGIFDFNPHFHKGSDSSEYLQQYIDRYFNPHFHKGSDAGGTCKVQGKRNFNPHFHKGSDGLHTSHCRFVFISIHTSTREVTTRHQIVRFTVLYFNPHFHKGSDISDCQGVKQDCISIHTSTREVTWQVINWYNRP